MKTAVIYFAIGVIVLFIACLFEHKIRRGKMRRSVCRNLDSAFTNGYFEPGEQLHNASPDEIAYDLTCFAVDFEDARPETLTPYVRQWMRQKGL